MGQVIRYVVSEIVSVPGLSSNWWPLKLYPFIPCKSIPGVQGAVEQWPEFQANSNLAPLRCITFLISLCDWLFSFVPILFKLQALCGRYCPLQFTYTAPSTRWPQPHSKSLGTSKTKYRIRSSIEATHNTSRGIYTDMGCSFTSQVHTEIDHQKCV